MKTFTIVTTFAAISFVLATLSFLFAERDQSDGDWIQRGTLFNKLLKESKPTDGEVKVLLDSNGWRVYESNIVSHEKQMGFEFRSNTDLKQGAYIACSVKKPPAVEIVEIGSPAGQVLCDGNKVQIMLRIDDAAKLIWTSSDLKIWECRRQ